MQRYPPQPRIHSLDIDPSLQIGEAGRTTGGRVDIVSAFQSVCQRQASGANAGKYCDVAQTEAKAAVNLAVVSAEITAIRLLVDRPLPGLENMARDEVLHTFVGAGRSAATLRLYQWAVPTVSLGYFQRFSDFEALAAPAGNLPVVRRPTGGGAILHDMELTYSLSLPADYRLLSDGPNRLYEWMHDAIIMALGSIAAVPRRCGITDDSTPTRGPFFCFARRHCFDVTVDGTKLAGSAQRRTRAAILQHGSIILGSRYDQQPSARTGLDPAGAVADLRECLPRHFGNVTGEAIQVGAWTGEELAAIPGLLDKHAGEAWLRRM